MKLLFFISLLVASISTYAEGPSDLNSSHLTPFTYERSGGYSNLPLRFETVEPMSIQIYNERWDKKPTQVCKIPRGVLLDFDNGFTRTQVSGRLLVIRPTTITDIEKEEEIPLETGTLIDLVLQYSEDSCQVRIQNAKSNDLRYVNVQICPSPEAFLTSEESPFKNITKKKLLVQSWLPISCVDRHGDTISGNLLFDSSLISRTIL